MAGALSGCTIVFDLDGTLVDTAPDLLRALNQVMDLEGLPRVPAGLVRHLVGHGARAMIEGGAALSGAHFTGARLDQLVNAFIDFYKADIASASRPFPGAVEALEALKADGALLAVCTNKRTGLSVQLLDELKLGAYFAAIVGADSVVNRKPHPDHFLDTVSRAGGVRDLSLLVGDSPADAGAAQAAARPIILCRFGYGGEDIEALTPNAFINNYDGLPALARDLLGR